MRHRDVGDGRIEHDHEVAEREHEPGEHQQCCRTGAPAKVAAALPSAAVLPATSIGRVHRQADAQRMRCEFLGIERDAHRQALDDLDPVAGRVLRRDQREGRAGAAGEAGTLPWNTTLARHRDRDVSSTGWPGCTSCSWPSLKLAST